MLKKILLGLGALVLLILLVIGTGWWVGAALFVESPQLPLPVSAARPEATGALNVPDPSTEDKQILFGDLHVHTSYSLDAAIFGTPASKGTGYTTPTDACDFARYCSALDFWSINDHAEGIAPWQWSATKEAIRQCNQVTDPAAPDMVSFLGWEWTQGASNPDPEKHYGHKNVILRDIGEDQVPTRPIAASTESIWHTLGKAPAPLRGLALLAMSRLNMEGYQSLAAHLRSISETPDCGQADVRDLPIECYESADTPTKLFQKLDQWGFDALVIPHGMAWGNSNPIGADFNYQMDQHNEKYQRLLEIFSGHGNSEIYRDLGIALPGDSVCPEPANGFTPCCWQAGEIIRRRCKGNGGEDCEDRAQRTQKMYLDAMNGVAAISLGRSVVPDTHPDDWAQCDQLTGSFQPAHDYQAKQTAQYMLTLGNKDKRYRPGFIGSSDNHTARTGTGYKEIERFYMTDTRDTGEPVPAGNPASDQPVTPSAMAFLDKEDGANGFLYTGGLVAVHSQGRNREAIWDALQRRAVYGTSGPRIGLWFDLVEANGEMRGMGSEVATQSNPSFRVGATGSIKQKPGCPDYVHNAMGPERTQSLCRNECFNPSDEAFRIDRIEVVRVLPRNSAQEKTADLIQDPWRVFDCSAQGSQCTAEFTDPEFISRGREAAYYVRAIQEATETIQGDPFRCEYDAQGQCVKTNLCIGIGKEDDCLSPAQHRAWSSPIYVRTGPGIRQVPGRGL
jgi:hypothetical protein